MQTRPQNFKPLDFNTAYQNATNLLAYVLDEHEKLNKPIGGKRPAHLGLLEAVVEDLNANSALYSDLRKTAILNGLYDYLADKIDLEHKQGYFGRFTSPLGSRVNSGSIMYKAIPAAMGVYTEEMRQAELKKSQAEVDALTAQAKSTQLQIDKLTSPTTPSVSTKDVSEKTSLEITDLMTRQAELQAKLNVLAAAIEAIKAREINLIDAKYRQQSRMELARYADEVDFLKTMKDRADAKQKALAEQNPLQKDVPSQLDQYQAAAIQEFTSQGIAEDIRNQFRAHLKPVKANVKATSQNYVTDKEPVTSVSADGKEVKFKHINYNADPLAYNFTKEQKQFIEQMNKAEEEGKQFNSTYKAMRQELFNKVNPTNQRQVAEREAYNQPWQEQQKLAAKIKESTRPVDRAAAKVDTNNVDWNDYVTSATGLEWKKVNAKHTVKQRLKAGKKVQERNATWAVVEEQTDSRTAIRAQDANAILARKEAINFENIREQEQFNHYVELGLEELSNSDPAIKEKLTKAPTNKDELLALENFKNQGLALLVKNGKLKLEELNRIERTRIQFHPHAQVSNGEASPELKSHLRDRVLPYVLEEAADKLAKPKVIKAAAEASNGEGSTILKSPLKNEALHYPQYYETAPKLAKLSLTTTARNKTIKDSEDPTLFMNEEQKKAHLEAKNKSWLAGFWKSAPATAAPAAAQVAAPEAPTPPAPGSTTLKR